MDDTANRRATDAEPTPASPEGPTAPVASRRWLLRSSALAAGTAGVAALAAAVPTPAQAADGDAVMLGADNASSSTTTVTIDGTDGGADPTLALANANGPSLYLQPLNYEDAPSLALGEIANTQFGPVVGVDSLVGLQTTFVATGIDLQDLPTPYALPTPKRLLDTRTSAGRAGVLRTSAGAFDSAFRVRAGAWLDIEVTVEDAEFEVPSAFVNVAAVTAQGTGFLSVYPPGDRPGISTVNFAAGQTIANQTFVATGVVLGRYAVRIFSSSVTHLIADLTGVTIRGGAPVAAAAASPNARRKVTTRQAALRLRSTLADKLRRSLSR